MRTTRETRDSGRIDLTHTAYESVDDLLRAAQTRADTPTADTPIPSRDESVSVSPRHSKFTGTESLPAAIELARTGWPEGTARLMDGLSDALSVPTLNTLMPAWEYDLGGEYPDVSAYCAGEPEHMVTPVEQQSAVRPVIRITIIGCYPWMLTASDIENYGIALLSILNAIHVSGRAFELEWLSVCQPSSGRNSPKYFVDTVPLTTPGRPFDIDRLAVALHPSLNRRLIWSRWELDADLIRPIGDTYGLPHARPPHWLREPDKIYLPGPGELYKQVKHFGVQTALDHLTRALRREATELFTAP